LLVKSTFRKIGDQRRPTGFPERGVLAAAVKGISFPLEREEAVDIWAPGAVVGAEASKAATVGGAAPDLAFLDGGSMNPSSLQGRNLIRIKERNVNDKSKTRILGQEVSTYRSKRSSSSAKPPAELFTGEALAASTAALTKVS
jgi:hypothetical protein